MVGAFSVIVKTDGSFAGLLCCLTLPRLAVYCVVCVVWQTRSWWVTHSSTGSSSAVTTSSTYTSDADMSAMFDYDYLYQVDAAVSSVLKHHTVGEVDPWGRSVHQGGGQGARVIVAAAVGEVVAAADRGEQQHLRREKRVL